MDSKELKVELKKAREAIKEKDYKTTIKICKAILKVEKENYNAWVFIGVAMQESGMAEQAEDAFHRAIEISGDQVLAYQGLATFYEKQNKKEKHLDTLMKLAKLVTNDPAKFAEATGKIRSLAKELNDKQKIIEILQFQLKVSESGSKNEYEILHDLSKELSNAEDLTKDSQKVFSVILKKILESPLFTQEDCKKIISLYKNLKCKDGFTDEIMKSLRSTCLTFVDDDDCLEWLLKTTINSYIEHCKIEDDICYLIKVAKPKHEMLRNILDVILLISGKQYVIAETKLQKVLTGSPSSIECLFLLCKVQLKLHQARYAEHSARKGLQLAIKFNGSRNIIGHFYLFLGEALAGNKCWENSFKALEKSIEYLGRTPEILAVFCFTLLAIDLVERAEKIYSELSSSFSSDLPLILQLSGYIHLLKKEYSEASQKLRESCKDDSFEGMAFSLHLIGRTLWETEEYDKAYELFFKAAVLDPFYPKNFVYLGQYFMQVKKNKMKGAQCYQKAFDLDNYDDEIARYLSNALRILGDNERNFKVLKRITELAPSDSCKWAWTQLGLCQLEKDLISDAIVSFQKIVRDESATSHGFQCLGEAYLKRGSYESAYKAFEKASELDPKAMYPLYQIATIQKARGLFSEAIEKFTSLLDLDPSYIPALFGLAESQLLLGKAQFKDCLFGRAKDSIEQTLTVLARVAVINVNLLSLWALAAETCTFCFHFSSELFPINVPHDLLVLINKNVPSFTKAGILMLGAKFYGQALSLKNNISSLWHDLGVNCYFQSQVVEPSLQEDCAKKAFVCLQYAVAISPHIHEHWTTLGITAANQSVKDYALAQHAFLKSIEIEKSNAEAWTNLGILYLQQDNIKLSHNCFKMAQSLDPSYPISWLGQAIIADSVQHLETVDLFKHSITLCTHEEALLGYARNVCMTLLDTSKRGTVFYKYNIEEMDAIYLAAESMQKYTANNSSCPEAYMYFGILLERQHLYSSSLKAFERALNLFISQDKAEEIEKARINYARVLCKVGQVEDAVAEYLKLKKLDVPLLCSFGHALLQNKNFEKALEMFERAFNLCSSPADKSHILVAMAIVCWNSSDIPKTLQLLVKNMQMNPSSPYGLLALRAIGIMKNEESLSTVIQKSLAPFERHKNFISSITLLDAIEAHAKDGLVAGRNVFLKSIRLRPDHCLIWVHAASCLIQWDTAFGKMTGVFTDIAKFHGGDEEETFQVLALSKLASGRKNIALRVAQEAVRIRPDKVSNWVVLAAACHIADVNRKNIGRIFSFVKKLAKQQGIKADLVGWLTVIEAYHYICCKDYDAAGNLLNQAVNVSVFSPKILSALQILYAFLHVLVEKDKIDPLVRAVQKNSGTFLGWQLLVQVLLKSEKFDEAEKMLAQFIITTSKFFPNLKLFPFIQIGLLSYKAMKITGNKDRWQKVGEDALGEVVKVSPENKPARFLQGLIALESDNSNLARRSFEKICYSSTATESRWMEKIAIQTLKDIYKQKNDNEAFQKLTSAFMKAGKTMN